MACDSRTPGRGEVPAPLGVGGDDVCAEGQGGAEELVVVPRPAALVADAEDLVVAPPDNSTTRSTTASFETPGAMMSIECPDRRTATPGNTVRAEQALHAVPEPVEGGGGLEGDLLACATRPGRPRENRRCFRITSAAVRSGSDTAGRAVGPVVVSQEADVPPL